MPYKDPAKQREAQNKSNKRRRAKINAAVTAQRLALSRYVQAKKDRPCQDCGKKYPSRVMDYHHLRDKIEGVGGMPNKRRTKAQIDAEIAKCVLLCANCHRLRHGPSEDVL